MIPVITGPRQTVPDRRYNREMKTPRIAIIGDTECRAGAWTGAAAIAIETAAQGNVEIGLRSVATGDDTAGHLRAALEAAGVTPWVSVREESRELESSGFQANVRMGDPLHIPALFDHDVIVLACRDARLRRFLADLPVHTRPDVRIIACLHLDRGPVTGERLEDLLRFDTLIGSDGAFRMLSGSFGDEFEEHPLVPVQRHMHGSNLRTAIAWSDKGACGIAEREGDILSIPPVSPATPPSQDGLLRWPAFVGAVALGIARRQRWDEIGRLATEAWNRPSYT